MHRRHIELTDIAAWDNLLLAVWKAARGKRQRPDVARFLAETDDSLQQLASDILVGAVPYGRYRSFHIHDPKLRLIHAACFEDRVLHHAIINLAEPVFERSLVPTTYACRPGKGVHRAVVQVQNNLRRFPWFVQVDVDGYFPAIDHSLLFGLLQHRFKGDGFMALLWRIIDSYHARLGKGLPIGALTSQHFANHYLDGADRFLLNTKPVGAMVRYMDDMIWWCHDKPSALQTLAGLREFLHDKLSLRLKPTTQINRSSRGVTYCGFRILPGTVLLTPRKQRRYRSLREQWETAWLEGNIDSNTLQQAYAAVHAITLHADSRTWRQRNLQLHPSQVIQ
ncbi:MAG: reverse transcriptase/maturase family protein [Proteobacteria bacterium]|nr:reverse transcriptase/maturase family protein [Pseudomonadota bacterium]